MDEATRQLREALKDNTDFTSRSELDMVGDFRVQRFLISRGMNVEKAKIMLEDHLKWRQDHHLEKIRAEVIGKPFLVSSFPHAAELKAVGMGMLHVVVNGGRSRNGELVHLESIGGTSHFEVPEGKTEAYIEMLYEHYYGFFERRSIELETLSLNEKRMVRGLQIRDFSRLSIMPQGGIMSIIRKILKSGLDNYPESASTVFFVNCPTIFTAIFSIVKHWLPEDTKKKLHFCSGDDVPLQLLRHVRPAVVVALDRMLGGELGDVLSQDLLSDQPYKTVGWKQSFELAVSARSVMHKYFVMSKSGTKTITWKRDDGGEAPKSTIHAAVLYNRSGQESGVQPDDIQVCTALFKDVCSITLPAESNEALVILYLDHSASWFHGHTFRFTVEGT